MNYILLCWYCWVMPSMHIGHLAEYRYQLEGEQLKLEFVIKQEDLLHFDWSDNCNWSTTTALCLARYLNEKSRIEINGQALSLSLDKSYTENGHFIAHLSAPVENTTIKELKISNSCFWEFNPRFRNRIILEVGAFKGSYMLKRKKNVLHLKQ